MKVALNLSAGRRSINKNSEETSKNNKTDEINSADLVTASDDANVSSEREPAHVALANDSTISQSDNASNLSENVAESSCPAAVLDDKVSASEPSSTTQSSDNTFKTPMNLSKVDSDTFTQSSVSSKYRKFKFAPRLDSFRNIAKPQQVCFTEKFS